MIVTGLDDKEYSWNLYNKKKRKKVSSLHERARLVLSELFPFEIIVEEALIPGVRWLLYADFILPSLRIMVEVQGEQHYKFVPFFHDNKIEYYKAVARDNMKKQFCEINDITLIELPHTEDDNEWRKRIREH